MTYTVVEGDSLSAIAYKFNITLQELEAANPEITNPDDIKVGQVLNIPQQQPEAASLNDDQKYALQLHNAGILPVLTVSRPTYPFPSISYLPFPFYLLSLLRSQSHYIFYTEKN